MNKPTSLSEQALRKLPQGQFIKFTVTKDMSGKERPTVVWLNLEPHPMGPSKQNFATDTGEYLGEAF